ncbi:hypothetical protein RHSIM_Rhsim04G0043900 [Rhododendron simsii]|uniref:FAS1 domain-containing protein n=1 Tax=Rhododendron simsii TaxID=118357 RepID=A0A834LQT6_RHOSS|nr:hypothetical protein RHSIM_Rhsim04G0043900 [Rhododendron simsii]
MGMGKMTDFTVVLIVTTTLVLIFSPSAYSQSDNLGDILGAPASSYSSFYSLLESSTGTSRILQDQANTQQGLTLFVPNNNAFATDPVPWGTLSPAQIQSLILFHAVPQYYGISALNTLSQLSPVVTMAGGQYTLNFTVVSQALYLNSGWTIAKVVDVVKLNTSTLQIYQIDAVLKPEAIFGEYDEDRVATTPYLESLDRHKGFRGTRSVAFVASNKEIISSGRICFLF